MGSSDLQALHLLSAVTFDDDLLKAIWPIHCKKEREPENSQERGPSEQHQAPYGTCISRPTESGQAKTAGDGAGNVQFKVVQAATH